MALEIVSVNRRVDEIINMVCPRLLLGHDIMSMMQWIVGSLESVTIKFYVCPQKKVMLRCEHIIIIIATTFPFTTTTTKVIMSL